MDIKERIDSLDWQGVAHDMNERGYSGIGKVLTAAECDVLVSQYDNSALYRKTVVMERHGYGLGEYKYFQYPLPGIVHQLRESVYPKIAPVANSWMRALNIEKQYRESLHELLEHCRQHEQIKPTPLILRYGKGGYNALHQDLYGEIYFPMQLVVCLSEPGVDHEGGEFVLIEQKPRAQSKAIVLKPGKGDILLFTTNFRPAQGSKGYHRVNMKHGVSEITAGNRHTLGIIFHDAG